MKETEVYHQSLALNFFDDPLIDCKLKVLAFAFCLQHDLQYGPELVRDFAIAYEPFLRKVKSTLHVVTYIRDHFR